MTAQQSVPEGTLIASWQEGRMRLVDLGDGQAAVIITGPGDPFIAADVTYGEASTQAAVEWTRYGCLALEQYKRDAWNSQIYVALAHRGAGR